MRPTDWSALGHGSDPIPGDPATIRQLANHLIGIATSIRQQNSRLQQINAREIWDSDAAEGFEKLKGELPPDLDLAAKRYENVGNALHSWESALGAAQSVADNALIRAKDAQDDLTYANNGIQDINDWNREAARTAQTRNEANPDSTPVEPEAWTGPDYHSMKSDAEERLRVAKEDLGRALGDRDRAAGTAEGAVDGAANDKLKNLSGWKKFLLKAADVLSVVGAVLGVLSIFFPVLAPFALAIGLLSMGLNGFLAATGAKSWGDFWLDAIGVATFGIGRVAGLGARAFRLAPVARAGRTATAARGTALGNVQRATTARAALPGRTGPMPQFTRNGQVVTNASGQRLYGAAARNRMNTTYGNAIRQGNEAATTAGREASEAAARANAIRNPPAPANPWQAARQEFRPWQAGDPLGARLTGSAALGTGIGGLGLGGFQGYSGVNNMVTADHW